MGAARRALFRSREYCASRCAEKPPEIAAHRRLPRGSEPGQRGGARPVPPSASHAITRCLPSGASAAEHRTAAPGLCPDLPYEGSMIWRQMARWAAIPAALWLGSEQVPAESGMAAVYSYRNGKTASGERSDPPALTAAHRTLPFGTKVRVTNHRNARSVVVRINDRGPFTRGRVIDLTPAAAGQLGFAGLAPVSLAPLGR